MLSCLKYPPSSCNSPPHPLNYALTFPPNHSCRVQVLRHLTGKRNRVSALTSRCQAKSADTEKPVSLDNENDSASSTTSSTSTSFLSFLCPLLKLFSQGDPSQARNYNLEFTTSFLSTLARFPWGSTAVTDSLNNQATISSDPPQRLQLFEFEACPFCRRVREAMTELDLSVDVYPCPKGSIKHRELVKQLGGKELFPFLVDPNTGVSMYESGDIVKYLFQQYGKRSPSVGLLESTLLTGWMPTLLRAGRGMSRWEKATPDMPPKKLELFSYENNPNARIVREALCELEIPYVLLNVGAGSKRTDLLINLSGNQKVPYLVDPNTGAEIGDYKEILAYLFKTYSLAAA
ncbi:hypothetical protein K2173_007200 [Erythroxylum novogranatense]|uniref:GST N-terminal domain-containing protein n=1 Tax=Erythroxylum novogranatense TaxID=1862640 RepID=A0AAV8SYU0_9ROSI|nr:hypothetical protein K2173_007200 [Erythroxylum novogranatense]